MEFLQALEQLEASLRDLAPVLATYYKALVASGFSEDQALALVEGVQNRAMYPDA